MSQVAECTVPECVYNRTGHCFARAITVGPAVHTECLTFFSANHHTARRGEAAGVGACKVYACRHNDDYECSAANVHVGYADGEIGCLSFSKE